MSGFKVGEVAIGQGFVNWPEFNGAECVIVSGLEFSQGFDPRDGLISVGWRYACKWPDGDITFVKPQNLRKRRPPASDESAHRQAMLDCIERAKRGVEVEA